MPECGKAISDRIAGEAMKTPTEFLIRVQQMLDGFGRTEEPLDPIARNILLHISAKSDAGERLRLSDIRFNSQFGSPATALGRLQGLIDEGWVTTSPDPDDGRAQVLRLSKKSEREIMRLTNNIRGLVQ